MTPASPLAVDVACYYHTAEKVPLLYDAVLPAARQAQMAGLDVHLERHWLHGPHLRIRMTGRRDQVSEAAEVAAETLRKHLASRPSESDQDASVLLREAVLRGRADLVAGPYEPIHPNNSVRIEPADESHVLHLLGSPAAVVCRANLLRAGMEPVAESAQWLIEHGNSSTNRVWLTVTAMAVHASAYPLGLFGGSQSFRSHLEDFLHLNDSDGKLRSRFDHAWRSRTEQITDHVARITTVEGCAEDPIAPAWNRWVKPALAVCTSAFERGELPLVLGNGYTEQARAIGDPETVRRWDEQMRTSYSPYHTELRKLDFLNMPGMAENFGPYRFATNMLYLLLALCDVTPLERYLAAYLFSEAVQRLTGITWQESLARHVAASTGTGATGGRTR
ncbi:lantibiotic dehydratase C-terminal domain-containing protein [Streptomyces sp. NPDC001617]